MSDLTTPRAPVRGWRERLRQPGFLRRHSDGSGQPRQDLWEAGIKHAMNMPTGAAVGGLWTEIGPAPIRSFTSLRPDSGEVLDIAIDPSGQVDQVIYIACNDGGIWKSTDAGDSWRPMTELMPSLSMGAVALDPGDPSIVYAGTGNLHDGGNQFSKGIGIYRSIDAGETWSLVVSPGFAHAGITSIVLPAPGVLLVATINGLYYSVDRGWHFGANPPSFDDGVPVMTQWVTGLSLDTQSPSTVYACVTGQGIFVSQDSGATFPQNLFANPGAPAPPYSFLSFAQSSRPDGQTMYASVGGPSAYAGLFRSTDGGSTWAVMPAAGLVAPVGSLGYAQTVGVDPLDPNRVYLGFTHIFVSTDGGGTFNQTGANSIHEDHHAVVFSPAPHLPASPPSQLYVGTDGGVATSPNGGATWMSLNAGIATNLFVGIDIGRGAAASNGYTYGGTQDTGTPFHRPDIPGRDWHLTIGGDGGPVAVDPGNPRRAYSSSGVGPFGGTFVKTSDGGSTWTFGAAGLPTGVYAVAVDAGNGANVYAGVGTTLYQSRDAGASFTAIATFSDQIHSIATTPLDSNMVWVATAGVAVHHTANALAGPASSWTQTTPGAPAWMIGESVAIDPTDVNSVVVAYSGLSGINPTNRTGHLFQTSDGGTTWTDIGGTDGGDPLRNLPDIPLHSVVIDPAVQIRGLFGVAAGPSVKGLGGPLIAVGLDGTIVASADGVVWAPQASGTKATLSAGVWDGGQWVVVGLNGTILTSPDGVTWTPRNSHTTDALQGIAWSGSLFVVADASTSNVLTSPDGVSWTVRPLGTPNALLAVTWESAQFVGVGYNGAILTSPTGITWTPRTSGVAVNLGAVTGGTELVAGGLGGTLLTSPTGVTWTARSSGVTAQVNGLARSGTGFVAVLNSGGILTSPDGVTWTLRSSGTGARLNAVIWTGSQFVAVGDFGTILTSADGIGWTPRPPGSLPRSVVVASDAGVMRSQDGGATWHQAGAGLPAVDCKSLALDWSVKPSLLRVGTYGRSVFELTTPVGPAQIVNANLGFGFVPAGSSATLQVGVFNVGSADVSLATFYRATGSSDFSISMGGLPAVLAPGTKLDFPVTFTPSGPGDSTATFRLDSTDPVQPIIDVPASGTGV